ncbi:putative PurR-regulated permease PerM [Roseateles toxinivorans]|uniref:Putative PurR-regulated permease PerM n=1 Tax=Roseateles toxinivorans TaxID=270368 RepID=A0A4R6QLH6_9BURK|nr:putative PurR-regulated permease PerM [Roseateles toxinivorans]
MVKPDPSIALRLALRRGDSTRGSLRAAERANRLRRVTALSESAAESLRLAAQGRDGLAVQPRASAPMLVLAVLACMVALWWGRSVLIPLTGGVLLALLVEPAVLALQRVLRWRALAVPLALTGVVAVVMLAGYGFGGQLLRTAERVPEMITLAAQRVREIDPQTESLTTRVRRALGELDAAASRLTDSGRPVAPLARSRPRPAPAAAVAAPAASAPSALTEDAGTALRATAMSGTTMLLQFGSDATILMLVAFFVLTGAPSLSRKLISQWGNDPRRRLAAANALRECGRQVRLYAGVLLFTNVLIALTVWLMFSWAGLPDAAGWGVTAGVLHVVPYLGMVIMTGLGAAEAFLAFDSGSAALAIAGLLLVSSTLIGTVITAFLQGRAARMNAAAVFIGVVLWGGLWGLWGLFLGPVLIVLMKVMAEHSRSAQRLALLLRG